jgi:hypothetical protein
VTKALVVTGVGGVVSALVLGAAGPAAAASPGSSGPSLSGLEVIGIFAGIPLALFALIVLLVLAPSMVKGGGRQPGLDWDGQPEWFGARPGAAPVATSQPATSQPGGRSGEEAAGSRGDTDSGDTDRGGAGGRW